ncbi:hypothetical protein BDN71DRAFT_720202 [Pleurotus eryngii]|uniref:Uncharacterized protein n=1 Tax=Pleurotus eryngii TaxID=5323 RepID=A0A9P6DK90_PLEER|nr:hypothetical protein BDN71DRAFT_720202 [Pleurotus eryngii]
MEGPSTTTFSPKIVPLWGQLGFVTPDHDRATPILGQGIVLNSSFAVRCQLADLPCGKVLLGTRYGYGKNEVEVGPHNLPGGMGTSVSRDINTVAISWKAPSIHFIAVFDDRETTRNQAQALNGKVLMER